MGDLFDCELQVNGITLKIQVMDKDDAANDDLVDFLKVSYNSTPSRSEKVAEWSRLNIADRTRFVMITWSIYYALSMHTSFADPKAVFFLKYGWLEENYGGLFG